MQDFKKLIVWRKAHELVLEVHRATPNANRRGTGALVTQLRRAAISVPANIAEGCGHQGARELARFLQIAMASANELECHLLLARDLGVIARPVYERLHAGLIEVKRMLASLIQRVRATPAEAKNGRTTAIPKDPVAPTPDSPPTNRQPTTENFKPATST